MPSCLPLVPMNKKKFTVEQIELVRRLRNSGLTKEQISLAFESLDFIQNCLKNLPQSTGCQVNLSSTNCPITKSDQTTQNSTALLQQLFSQPQMRAAIRQPLLDANIQPLNQAPLKLTAPVFETPKEKQQHDFMNQLMQFHPILPKTSSIGISCNDTTVANNLLGEVDANELNHLLQKDETICQDEIRMWMTNNNVKLELVSIITGIDIDQLKWYSQGKVVGEHCRQAMKLFYIKNKSSIQNLGVSNALNSSNINLPRTPASQESNMDQSMTDFELTGQRRERFVFKPNQIELLERCFAEESYPSLARREEIVTACNAATEMITGRTLTEKERVGVATVSNWFANKRKDIKKLYKEEGVEMGSSLPILTRSRGRPPMSLTDTYQPGNGNSLLTNLKIDLETYAKNGFQNGSEEHPAMEVVISANEDSLLLSEEETAALHLSVELAGVNQAIFSLTGQLPIGMPLPNGQVATSLPQQLTSSAPSGNINDVLNQLLGTLSMPKLSTTSKSVVINKNVPVTSILNNAVSIKNTSQASSATNSSGNTLMANYLPPSGKANIISSTNSLINLVSLANSHQLLNLSNNQNSTAISTQANSPINLYASSAGNVLINQNHVSNSQAVAALNLALQSVQKSQSLTSTINTNSNIPLIPVSQLQNFITANLPQLTTNSLSNLINIPPLTGPLLNVEQNSANLNGINPINLLLNNLINMPNLNSVNLNNIGLNNPCLNNVSLNNINLNNLGLNSVGLNNINNISLNNLNLSNLNLTNISNLLSSQAGSMNNIPTSQLLNNLTSSMNLILSSSTSISQPLNIVEQMAPISLTMNGPIIPNTLINGNMTSMLSPTVSNPNLLCNMPSMSPPLAISTLSLPINFAAIMSVASNMTSNNMDISDLSKFV